MTQHANLSNSDNSDYVTFYCRATGTNTQWNIIGDTTYESYNHTQNGYKFSEVIVQQLSDGTRVHDMYMEILPTVPNNETEIQCIAYVDVFSFSQPVMLIVQGKSSNNNNNNNNNAGS